MKNWILAIALFFTLHTHAQEVAWTGMKTDRLIAISKQGEKGFQFAMLYILGIADGLEGQRAVSREGPCRIEGSTTNHEIASKVLNTVKALDKPKEPAGKVVINAYLSSYCPDSMTQ